MAAQGHATVHYRSEHRGAPVAARGVCQTVVTLRSASVSAGEYFGQATSVGSGALVRHSTRIHLGAAGKPNAQLPTAPPRASEPKTPPMQADAFDQAYAATPKFLEVSACGNRGFPYPAPARPQDQYSAPSTGLLNASPPSLCTGTPAVALSFDERVDRLCALIESVEQELVARSAAAADLPHYLLCRAKVAGPTDAEEAARAERRRLRQAQLDVARQRRQSAEAKRDALKEALRQTNYSWQLRIFAADTANATPTGRSPGRFCLRILPGLSKPVIAEKKPGGPSVQVLTEEAQKKKLHTDDHQQAVSERLHVEEALRRAMAAERAANAKERFATELEREALAEARAEQEAFEENVRQQEASRTEAKQLAKKKAEEEAAHATAAEVAALEAAALEAAAERQARAERLARQQARDDAAAREKRANAQAARDAAQTAAEAAARKREEIQAEEDLVKAARQDEQAAMERERERLFSARKVQREEEAAAATLAAHSEITAEAEQQAKERSRAALEATMKRNAVERERQRLSERRVREHKARVERQLAAAARKAELAKQTEAERSARQSILMRLKDAEQRVVAAQQEARLTVALTERKESERLAAVARAEASARAAQLVELQAERKAREAKASEIHEAHRQATLLLGDSAWGSGGSTASGNKGKVSRWSTGDVIEWFQKSFRWADRYVEHIQSSAIDGESLLVMDDAGLRSDLKMEVTAHRRVLLGKLEQLRADNDGATYSTVPKPQGMIPVPRTVGGVAGLSVEHRLNTARSEIQALRSRLAIAGGR